MASELTGENCYALWLLYRPVSSEKINSYRKKINEIIVEGSSGTYEAIKEGLIDDLEIMTGLWRACVNYMAPLGLSYTVEDGHHYGPDLNLSDCKGEPKMVREGLECYWEADEEGLGYDRTTSGTAAVSQHNELVKSRYEDTLSRPTKYFLLFHRLR